MQYPVNGHAGSEGWALLGRLVEVAYCVLVSSPMYGKYKC